MWSLCCCLWKRRHLAHLISSLFALMKLLYMLNAVILLWRQSVCSMKMRVNLVREKKEENENEKENVEYLGSSAIAPLSTFCVCVRCFQCVSFQQSDSGGWNFPCMDFSPFVSSIIKTIIYAFIFSHQQARKTRDGNKVEWNNDIKSMKWKHEIGKLQVEEKGLKLFAFIFRLSFT